MAAPLCCVPTYLCCCLHSSGTPRHPCTSASPRPARGALRLLWPSRPTITWTPQTSAADAKTYSCDICRSISRTGIPAAAGARRGCRDRRVQQDPEGHPPTLLWGLAGPVEDKARPTGAPACPPPAGLLPVLHPTPPGWPSHHPSRCYAAALAAVELRGLFAPYMATMIALLAAHAVAAAATPAMSTSPPRPPPTRPSRRRSSPSCLATPRAPRWRWAPPRRRPA